MNSIVWITPRCFVETDIYAIRLLLNNFKIIWYIIESGTCNEYAELLNEMSEDFHIKIEHLILPAKNRNLKCLNFYNNLLHSIKKLNPDLVYSPISGMPYYMPLLALNLNRDKTVVAVHNVTTPKGSKAPSSLSKLYTCFVAHAFKNYHTLSPSQCEVLRRINRKSNVFCIPFALKDYGISLLSKPEKITFLFFGQILEYKRVDVLIEAAQRVYEKTNAPFKVKIAGSCPFWDRYQKQIKYPELFELTIRRIDNSEIPDLFATSHYFVMPYQDIAQSGALMVAINYNLPVIASDIPAFVEYIKDGDNGYIFKPASVDELIKLIEKIVLGKSVPYQQLRHSMESQKHLRFSDESIRNAYIDNFNQIVSNQRR